MLFNYWYATEFSISTVGLMRYCNFTRLNIVVTETVITNSEIFSWNACPLHNDFQQKIEQYSLDPMRNLYNIVIYCKLQICVGIGNN